MAQSPIKSPAGTMDIRQGWNPCSMIIKYLSPVGATEQSLVTPSYLRHSIYLNSLIRGFTPA